GTHINPASSGVQTFKVGDYDSFNHIHTSGAYDEIEISDTNRSADWIATEYNNQSAPNAFYSLSREASAAATIESRINGNWSVPATWVSSQVPTQCNPVTIITTTTVTLDTTTAMASTTTINGILSASRVNNSTI